tara:strand:- start:670 stop:1335 length:666 start_codon:yes stop_codon:yes gene_type:complete
MIIKQGVNQMLNSFEDLTARFTEIASQPHVVRRKSHGAVGELFEELMVGEVVGNQSGADFAEIATEAKVHYRMGEMTLFSCKGEMFRAKDGARFPSLPNAEVKKQTGKSIFRMGKGLQEQRGQFVVTTLNNDCIRFGLIAWDIATLEARIAEKMPNLAMVKATKHNSDQVTFDALTVCRKIITSRFIDSIRKGEVCVEVRSNGTQFRASPKVISSWFTTVH